MGDVVFISNGLKKNFYNAFNSVKHCRSSRKYTIIRLKEFTQIPKGNPVYNHINLIVSEILHTDIIRNNFSRTFIENKVLYILETVIIENGFNISKHDFYSCCTNLIEKFELEINRIIEDEFDNYECIFRIDNIMNLPDMKIGDVILFKAKDIDEWVTELEVDDIENDYIVENNFYAKTTVYGSNKYAVRKAESNIKIALNILKLFLQEYFCNFNVEGSNYIPVDRKNIIKSSKGKYFVRKWINFTFPCNISDDEFKEIYIGVDDVSKLLKSKNRSEFENRLLTAIYWFGESISIPLSIYENNLDNEYGTNLDNLEYFDVYPKLLNLIIALETIFVWSEKSKSDAISKKTAVLIAKEGYEEYILKFIKKIYGNRSKIVHSGVVHISENDLNELIHYTRVAILTLLKLNNEYRDKIRYFNKLYSNLN